jgi:hypothetical protein
VSNRGSLNTAMQTERRMGQYSDASLITHYVPTSATTLDRMHLSTNLIFHKLETKIVAPSFSDHVAVIMRRKLNASVIIPGRGYWKINSHLLEDTAISTILSVMGDKETITR